MCFEVFPVIIVNLSSEI